jgi:Bacterial extracellular solute-binding proteins, family 3
MQGFIRSPAPGLKRRFSWVGLMSLMAGGLPERLQAQPAQDRLRFGYFDRYAPLSERVLDGQAAGLLVSRVDAVLDSAGLAGEHLAFPWPRVQAMVADGRLDGFCTLSTPERERYALFGNEVLLEDRSVLVHRRGDPRIRPPLQALADLQALRLGTYRGDGFAQLHLGQTLLRFDDGPDSVLRRIALGDLDGFIEGEVITARRLRQLRLQEQLQLTPLPFVPAARFRLGLRRSLAGAPALLERLDASAAQLRRTGRLATGV